MMTLIRSLKSNLFVPFLAPISLWRILIFALLIIITLILLVFHSDSHKLRQIIFLIMTKRSLRQHLNFLVAQINNFLNFIITLNCNFSSYISKNDHKLILLFVVHFIKTLFSWKINFFNFSNLWTFKIRSSP